MTQGEHYSSPGKGRSSPGRSSPDLYHNKLSNHSRARPMWRQHVETSERGWLTNKIALFGQFSELLPHPAPIICRALTRLQAPEATPSTPVTIPHPALSPACLCAQRILPIFVQCRPSPMKSLPVCPQTMRFSEGHDGARRSCQTVSVLKAYASPASERGESQTQT